MQNDDDDDTTRMNTFPECRAPADGRWRGARPSPATRLPDRRGRHRRAALNYDGEPRGHPPRRRRALATCCWLYLLAVVACWLLTRFAGERWWVATLLLFGPRWLAAAPLALLLPAAVWLRRRCLIALAPAAIVALVPLAGARITLPALSAPTSPAALRVLSFNVHEWETDAPALARVIAAESPQVVALQDWSEAHRAALFGGRAADWHVHAEGELCLASRYPIASRKVLFSEAASGTRGSATAYELSTPRGPLRVINVHLQSPHKAFQAVIDRRPGAAAKVLANCDARRAQAALVAQAAALAGPGVILLGDFNTPQESETFADAFAPWADAFDRVGWGVGYTYFFGPTAARIDHVLAGDAWRFRDCRTGPDVGSPHRPLIVDLDAATALP